MQTHLCFKNKCKVRETVWLWSVCQPRLQDFVFNLQYLTDTKVIKAKWWWCTSLVPGLEYL